MAPISQIQAQQVNPAASQLNKKAVAKDAEKPQGTDKNIADPVLNKMSHQLNESGSRATTEVSEQVPQNLIPDSGSIMMGAQSGNITAEFVANLLNKSPYEK